MNKMTIYHGSTEIVNSPLYGKGKVYNDYGQGFYCTEEIELAKEWACTENKDGYVNRYTLDMRDLKIVDLSSDAYTVLHWLAILMKFRIVRLSSPLMKKGSSWVIEHFMPDILSADIIVGYRADDSYFSFARAFVNNEISIGQLARAMKLGKLGKQIVLKSEKAFERIQFQEAIYVDKLEYYPKRKAKDTEARRLYLEVLEKEDIEGVFIRDLIRGEVQADDSRLR